MHIHQRVSFGDGPCGSHDRAKEPITVTPAEIIYQRHIAALEYARRTKSVAAACQAFGICKADEYFGFGHRYLLLAPFMTSPDVPNCTNEAGSALQTSIPTFSGFLPLPLAA
jgi:hypothetical protein